jgi:hypothetical protein
MLRRPRQDRLYVIHRSDCSSIAGEPSVSYHRERFISDLVIILWIYLDVVKGPAKPQIEHERCDRLRC